MPMCDDPSDGDSAPDDSGPADPGLKAVLQGQKKKRFKAPSVAKGHGWKPVWLDTYDWLRSHPNKTRQEWDDTPDEAPEYLHCICCVTHPNVGSGSGASTGSGVPSVGSGEGDREEQVDAFEAGGLFRMFGRMANQDAVRARAFPPASGVPTPR